MLGEQHHEHPSLATLTAVMWMHNSRKGRGTFKLSEVEIRTETACNISASHILIAIVLAEITV